MQESRKRRQKHCSDVLAKVDAQCVEGVDDSADPEEEDGEDEVDSELGATAFLHEHHHWGKKHSYNRPD